MMTTNKIQLSSVGPYLNSVNDFEKGQTVKSEKTSTLQELVWFYLKFP